MDYDSIIKKRVFETITHNLIMCSGSITLFQKVTSVSYMAIEGTLVGRLAVAQNSSGCGDEYGPTVEGSSIWVCWLVEGSGAIGDQVILFALCLWDVILLNDQCPTSILVGDVLQAVELFLQPKARDTHNLVHQIHLVPLLFQGEYKCSF